MAVEGESLGRSRLDLTVGLGQFRAGMKEGQKLSGDMDDSLRALAAVAELAQKALGDVKMSPFSGAESNRIADRIENSVGRVGRAAMEASHHLEEVKLGTSQAAETDANGDVIDRKLRDINRNANEARRSLQRVRLAGGSIRPGYGVGPFGAGYGRIGAFGTAVGLGIATAPAALPAAAGLLAGIPTLAAGAAGAIGTLVLAFQGMGKAIDGDAKAFAKLTPAQKQFVQEIRSLEPALQRMKQLAGTIMFPGLSAGLHAAASTGTLNAITNAVAGFARAIGQAGEAWGRYFGSAEFQKIFGPLMASGARNFTVLSGAALRLFDALGVLGRAAIPLVNWLSDMAAKASRLADAWIHARDASGGLAKGMAEAQRSLALVGRLALALVNAVGALARALYPVSNQIVVQLTNGLNALAGIFDRNRQTIRDLVSGALNALVIAVKLAASAVGLLASGLKVVAGVVNAVAGPIFTAKNAVAELAAAFVAVKIAGIVNGWKTSLVAAGQQAVVSSQMAQGAARAEAETYAASMATMEAATIGLSATIKSALISTGIGALVVAVGLAVDLIITHWETVKRVTLELANFIKNVFSAMWTAIKGAFQLGVYAITSQFAVLARVAAKAFGWVPVIGPKIKSALNEASSYIEGFRTNGIANMEKAGAQMGDAWGNAFTASMQKALNKAGALMVGASGNALKTVPMEGTLSGTQRYQGTPGSKTPYLSYLLTEAESTPSTADDKRVLNRIIATLKARKANTASLAAKTELQNEINGYVAQLNALDQGSAFGTPPPLDKNVPTSKAAVIPAGASHALDLASQNANKAKQLGDVGKAAQRYLEYELSDLKAAAKLIQEKYVGATGKARTQLFHTLTSVQNQIRDVRAKIAGALKANTIQHALDLASQNASKAKALGNIGTAAKRYLDAELANLNAAAKLIRDKYQSAAGKARTTLFHELTSVQNKIRSVRALIRDSIEKDRLAQIQFGIDLADLAMSRAKEGTAAYKKAEQREITLLRAEIAYLDKRVKNKKLSLSLRSEALSAEIAAQQQLNALTASTAAATGNANEAQFLSSAQSIIHQYAPNFSASFPEAPSTKSLETKGYETVDQLRRINEKLQRILEREDFPAAGYAKSSAEAAFA